jgi:hypothetical protein
MKGQDRYDVSGRFMQKIYYSKGLDSQLQGQLIGQLAAAHSMLQRAVQYIFHCGDELPIAPAAAATCGSKPKKRRISDAMHPASGIGLPCSAEFTMSSLAPHPSDFITQCLRRAA